MDQQKQKALALVEFMGSGHLKVTEGASRMEGSLNTPKDGRMQNETNFKVDFEVCQVRLLDLEPRTKTMVHNPWADVDPACQTPGLGSISTYATVFGSQKNVTMSSDSRNVNEKELSIVSADNAETKDTNLRPWNQ